MKLHASGEDYLETILVLQKKLGMVRSVDVARHMEVSKPSVCHAVAYLAGRRLPHNGRRSLSPSDRTGAARSQKKSMSAIAFLPHAAYRRRPVSTPKLAEADACRIEHVVSDETFCRLKEKYQSENENGEP